MRAPRDTLEPGSIRAGVTTRKTAMRLRAPTAVRGITTAVRATPIMEDQDIPTTATIHPGRLPLMGITRILTMGVIKVIRIHTTAIIPAVILTTNQDTTLQRLQQYNAAWVSSATIMA